VTDPAAAARLQKQPMQIFAMILSVCLLTGGIMQPEPPVADVCEINAIIDRDGETERLRQVILWRWTGHPQHRGHRVAQWWLCRPEDPQPTITHHRGLYLIQHQGRTVRARSVRHTRTAHDPEELDRLRLPQDHRLPYIHDPNAIHQPDTLPRHPLGL
jgi:hypothetical protein